MQGQSEQALGVPPEGSRDLHQSFRPRPSPDVATSKVNIGLVLEAMGKMSEAKQMFTEAAGIRRKVLGADHPLTKKSEALAAQ